MKLMPRWLFVWATLNGVDAAERNTAGHCLNPGYATAPQWYALQLSSLGQFDEAIAEMKGRVWITISLLAPTWLTCFRCAPVR